MRDINTMIFYKFLKQAKNNIVFVRDPYICSKDTKSKDAGCLRGSVS